MTKAVSLSLLALLSAGCVFNSVTKLDPKAANVELVRETDKPVDCKFLGKIMGRSHADTEKEARKGAENEMRNQTAKLKGNYALIENTRGGPVGTTSQREVVINGRALYCKTLEMQQEEEKKHEQALKEKEEREIKEAAEKERKAEEAKEAKERREREQQERDERKEKAKD
ncbi:MAG: DUF4156 domain-containing protein [Polyangiaceae bacterium]